MSNPEPAKFRRHSGAPGLYGLARARFERIEDKVRNRGASLADHPAAALAMFAFKYPTMLGFDGDARGGDPTLARNPENLFGIARVPCDTAMRERLDEVDPRELRPVFGEVFSRLRRGGGLKGIESVAGRYLVSIDGTEFSGPKLAECGSCCSRTHRGGATSYFHQMVCASLVRPGSGTAVPFMPEMIPETDGSTKNDCETNAAERLLPDLRREHSHPEFAVPVDGPRGKAPQVRLLRNLGIPFIIRAKPDDHEILQARLEIDGETCEFRDRDGTVHEFRWRNGAEPDNSNRDVRADALEYWERVPERRIRKAEGEFRIEPEKTTHCGWTAEFEIEPALPVPPVRAGRARWKIENETFNTLKNQGCNLGHNCGRGKKNLCSVLAVPALLAFPVDQVQERCCRAFQAAHASAGARVRLRDRMRSCPVASELGGWDDLMRKLAWSRARSPPAKTPADRARAPTPMRRPAKAGDGRTVPPRRNRADSARRNLRERRRKARCRTRTGANRSFRPEIRPPRRHRAPARAITGTFRDLLHRSNT